MSASTAPPVCAAGLAVPRSTASLAVCSNLLNSDCSKPVFASVYGRARSLRAEWNRACGRLCALGAVVFFAFLGASRFDWGRPGAVRVEMQRRPSTRAANANARTHRRLTDTQNRRSARTWKTIPLISRAGRMGGIDRPPSLVARKYQGFYE